VIYEFNFPLPRFVKARPGWVRLGAIVLLLCAVSLWIRTRYVGGQFWIDEAISVGIASHHLSAIPGVLRQDGSPPLYYVLLHFWMSMVGNTQTATHWLSEICAVLTIPVGYWAGNSISGKRAGLMTATLFAFSSFLDYYSVETRMYALMTLWGLLASVGFIRGFVFRERRFVALFGAAEALMLYTHNWAIFFGAGSFLSLVVLYFISDQDIRENFVRDVIYAYVGAVILFAPWIPNFFFQILHTAAPWDLKPRFGVVTQVATGVLGGASIAVVMLGSALIGCSGLFGRPQRLSREAKVALMLLLITVLTLAVAWVGSQITPAWVLRYFAPVVAPLLLLIAIGMSRSGVIGAVAVIFIVLFMARPSAFEPAYKTDMQDISGEIAPMLHPNDLVIVGQPEATALAYYDLPGGLKWASTMGPVADPSFMNWVNALKRYRAEDVWKVVPKLLDSLKPGQQVLYIRTLTEGALNWKAPWTSEIRRRSAQYGQIIADDKQLVPEAWAPHYYRGACCVADSAVLYKKV
jgi:hypothetical protein